MTNKSPSLTITAMGATGEGPLLQPHVQNEGSNFQVSQTEATVINQVVPSEGRSPQTQQHELVLGTEEPVNDGLD